MHPNAQALKVLAGEQRILKDLGEDSPCLKHLPKAQAAIEAYCRGDDEVMQEALKAIPFRSPYRDLRFLLGALAAFPDRIGEARRLLAQIRQDSPFAAPARVAAAVLAGDRCELKPAAREFANAILGQGGKAKQLFATLLAEARKRHEPAVQEALKALLIYYPDGKTAYRKHFSLPPVEEKRLAALAAERAKNLKAALELWFKVGSLYEQAGKRLEAAAVARRVAGLASKLYGPEAADAERMLQHALRLDPDHRGAWLELAEWYRRIGNGKALGKLLNDALARFPDDPAMLDLAAAAAIERGAFKHAARLTAKLLKLDPINQAACHRLQAATLSHARKQIAFGKLELAAKELKSAAEFAATPKEWAKLKALEGVLAMRREKTDPFSRICPPLPPPLWEFWLAAEVASLAPECAKPYLSQLRAVFKVAALAIDKTSLTGVLDLALEAAAQGSPMAQLLRPAQPFLRRGALLEWREEELETVCERLLALEQYQLVRDYVRASPLWKRNRPALGYFDVVAKCRGAAAELDQRDLAVLEQALEAAKASGRHRLAAWIAEFLEEYDRAQAPGLPLAEWKRPAQEEPEFKKIFDRLIETLFPGDKT